MDADSILTSRALKTCVLILLRYCMYGCVDWDFTTKICSVWHPEKVSYCGFFFSAKTYVQRLLIYK